MATTFESIDFNKLYKATVNVAEAIAELIKTVIEAVKKCINCFLLQLRDFLKQSKPHLFHLAYKHEKSKVRKKNEKRLWKGIKKWIKHYCDKNE